MIPHLSTPVSIHRATGAPLFRAARASSDLPIVAFAVALLLAFVAQAGAFLPRIDGLGASRTPEVTVRGGLAPATPSSLACEVADPDVVEVPRS